MSTPAAQARKVTQNPGRARGRLAVAPAKGSIHRQGRAAGRDAMALPNGNSATLIGPVLRIGHLSLELLVCQP